jgi:hypothetical protein
MVVAALPPLSYVLCACLLHKSKSSQVKSEFSNRGKSPRGRPLQRDFRICTCLPSFDRRWRGEDKGAPQRCGRFLEEDQSLRKVREGNLELCQGLLPSVWQEGCLGGVARTMSSRRSQAFSLLGASLTIQRYAQACGVSVRPARLQDARSIIQLNKTFRCGCPRAGNCSPANLPAEPSPTSIPVFLFAFSLSVAPPLILPSRTHAGSICRPTVVPRPSAKSWDFPAPGICAHFCPCQWRVLLGAGEGSLGC